MTKLIRSKMSIEFCGHLHTADLTPPFITQLGSTRVGNKRLSFFWNSKNTSLFNFDGGFWWKIESSSSF